MQIYTRAGDRGTTKLIGGRKVKKYDPRVVAYGTVDELNALVGRVAAQFSKELMPESPLVQSLPHVFAELLQLQHALFDVGNDLATPDELTGDYPYRTERKQTAWLEERIDAYADVPPAVEAFILPGGHPVAADLHVCRTVTRRAERLAVKFTDGEPTNPEAVRFLNRLSDYFFALARVVNAKVGVADVTYDRSEGVFHLDVTKDDLPPLSEGEE